MIARTTPYIIICAALAALFLSTTAYSQDICDGEDAVAGSVNGMLEAGDRVFVITADTPDHNGGGGLYISCDEGDSWYQHPDIGDGGNTVIADPLDDETIYVAAGFGFIYVSRDAGETWTAERPVAIGNIPVTALATRSDGELLAGMETGQLQQSFDYGVTWASINNSLPAEPIHAILADPGNSNRLLVAVGNEGVHQSLDGGLSFSPALFMFSVLPPAFWDVRVMTFAPSDTSIVIVGDSGGLFQSVDGGNVFSGMGTAAGVGDIGYGNRDTETLFFVSRFDGLQRSVDGGQSFATLKPDLPRSTSWYRSAVQLTSGRLLMGTAAEGIYKSDDEGVSWRIAGEAPPELSDLSPPTEVTANLSISVENLNGSGAIEIGEKANFRVVVRNSGPALSTATYVRFEWLRPSVNGGTSSKALDLSSANGNCTVGPNVETACTLGTLGVGQSATIEFSGTISKDYIGMHSITATASNTEGAFTSANGSVSSKRSIACYGDCDDESGGGSTGLLVLAMLTLMVLKKRRLPQGHVDRGNVHRFIEQQP